MQAPHKKQPIPSLEKSEGVYVRFTRLSLVLFFVLIALGGAVRAFEAGMGCPDWPRCYERWFPPLSIQKLPADYKAYYTAKRREKNQRLIRLLRQIGATQTANTLQGHVNSLPPTTHAFSPVKAWLEYINRLVGTLLGLCLLAQAVIAHRYSHHTNTPKWKRYALIALALVVLQGLLGAIVVQTHLLPTSITLHMLLSFALLYVLLRAWPMKPPKTPLVKKTQRYLWRAVGVCLIFQIVLGTQIRQRIEPLLDTWPRHRLIEAAQPLLDLHRLLACALMALSAILCYALYRPQRPPLRLIGHHPTLLKTLFLFATLAFSALIGGVLYQYALPRMAQIIHLWLPFVAFALWAQAGRTG